MWSNFTWRLWVAKVYSDGNGNIVAPKWLVAVTTLAIAVMSSGISFFAALQIAVSAEDLSYAMEQREMVTGERWSGHQRIHDRLTAQLDRIEGKLNRLDDKIDRAIERR